MWLIGVPTSVPPKNYVELVQIGPARSLVCVCVHLERNPDNNKPPGVGMIQYADWKDTKFFMQRRRGHEVPWARRKVMANRFKWQFYISRIE